MNYIMVIISTILLAFDFAVLKKYQSSEGTGLAAGLRFNTLNGLFTAIIFFCLSGFKFQFSLFSLIMGFLMALFCIVYSVLGLQVLKSGNMAIYSVFLMSGGMILPYIFGILFLNEEFTLLRLGGLIIILAAVIISNRGKVSLSGKIIMLCSIIFILNGFVSIVSKCHQVTTDFPAVDSTAFVMYTGICRFVLGGIGLLLCGRQGFRFNKKAAFALTPLTAIISGVSYFLQLIGAKNLPATVLYPLITGGSIIFSALAGKFLFKEKLSVAQIISVALCFVGTLLFL